jgi:hypothetical protein
VGVEKCYFLVHEVSYRAVTSIAEYIRVQLALHSPLAFEFHICKSISDISPQPGSVIFIVGDPFAKLTRADGCKYVFLNFSVLLVLGNPLKCGLAAFKLLRNKRKIFEDKLPCYDYVLDYWPEQTSAMQRKYAIPIDSFPVAAASRKADSSKKIHDVCLVGVMTPRRRRLSERLRSLGVSMSPSEGVVMEDTAARSRIVLNAQAGRSNHLEIPRIIGAFASGALLITENKSGMKKAFPDGIYVGEAYSRLAKAITTSLADDVLMSTTIDAATHWYNNVYIPRCDDEWGHIITKVFQHFAKTDALQPGEALSLQKAKLRA